jgi:hypothetical protein
MPINLRKRRVGASMSAAAVGVVYDKELVWQQGYGLVDRTSPTSYLLPLPGTPFFSLPVMWQSWHRHVDASTIFRIGSVTKVMTTVMLFKLRDEGKIHLDEPIHVCPLYSSATRDH